MHDIIHSARSLALRVLCPFAGAYFLSYLYRTVNAVLAPSIAADIALDASTLGLMTGMYLLAFGAFQLPLGLLLDRFGPRRVESCLLLFAAAGAALFAVADQAWQLIAGRALVGLGVSACLMAAIKANVQFYPARRLAFVNGLVLFAGGMGAVAATQPVQAALAVTDWRGIFWVLSALTLVMAGILFVTVPDKPGSTGSGPLGPQLREIAAILRHRDFLRVAPAAAVTLGAFMAIQGLWAGPWMRDVAGLDGPGVAQALLVMAAGMACGYLAWGTIADHLGRRNVHVARVSWMGMVLFLLCLAAMAGGVTLSPLVLAAAFGFCGSSISLGYVVVVQLVPAHMSGRATTSLNLTIFAAAFVLQWGLGAIINLWPRDGAGHWPVQAHLVAFAVPAVLGALALLWLAPLAWRCKSASTAP